MKTSLKNIKSIFFLGIGGIGQSALARYFMSLGVHVSGYDKTRSPLTEKLENEGVTISYLDQPPEDGDQFDLVVYTPAVPVSTTLFKYFKELGVPFLKRSEVLGILSQSIQTIAVAGTHGKTTICAMLTHIMKQAGIPMISLMGGISSNYNTNFFGHDAPKWLIAEADEYDRSFLHLSPKLALISAIDNDHLDVYGCPEELERNFTLFAKRISQSGSLISKTDVLHRINHSGQRYSYGMSAPADYYLTNIRLEKGRHVADIDGIININGVSPGHPGRHNLENALAAAALAHQAGVELTCINAGISTFKGVKRRFEILLETKDIVYIDDYAHHPEEISACIRAIKELWPGKKITGVFQPHLFSRTKDLADQFAVSLSELDELILLDIYPAREEPMEGVNAQMLLQKIESPNANHFTKQQLLDYLETLNTDILVTMGAGDIERLTETIRQILIKNS